jgi:hypothetical protein
MEDVKRVENLLSTRTRKRLAYQTPNDTNVADMPIALAT